MKTFDLIVVGSGAGNIVLDAALAKGKRCALVEKDAFGGTCLNRGCIPSKILLSVADRLVEDQHKERMGLVGGNLSVDWKKLSHRLWKKLEERHEVKRYYEEKGVSVYQARAAFHPSLEKTLELFAPDGTKVDELTAETIVLGTGARTNVPPVKGLVDLPYLCSERFFGKDYPEVPYKSLIILGGGAIGCEFAHLFNALGTKVTVVQRNVRLLPKSDAILSQTLQENFGARGIEVLCHSDLLEAGRTASGLYLDLKNRETGELKRVEAEQLFVASGVKPNSDTLAIEHTKLMVSPSGHILVNECMETSVPGIYALGDLVGHAALRHKANNEAELLAENLYGKRSEEGQLWRRQSYEFVPHVTFTYPEVAHVGLSEEEAKARYGQVMVAIRRYSENAKGYALGYEGGEVDDGLVKVLVHPETQRILGVHIIGTQASLLMQSYVYLLNASHHEIEIQNPQVPASKRCQEARQAAKATVDFLPDSVDAIQKAMTAHPALSEVSAWVFEALKPI